MKMKRLLLFAVMLICIGVSGQTFNANFNFANYTTQPTAVSLLSLTPQQPNYNYTNSTLVPTPIYVVTGNSGQVTVSNLIAGYSYLLDLKVAGVDYYFTNNYPVGLTGTVSSWPYNGFWSGQIFCYYTPPGVVYTTNSTITYFTNFFNVTNNLSGTNFGVSVSGTGGATVTTNGNTFTVNVPLQTSLTNGLGTAALYPSNTFILSTALPALTNQLLPSSATNALVETNDFTTGTNAVAVSAAAALVASNALNAAALNAAVATLNATVAASSNALNAAKQPLSPILTAISGTGAFTNALVNGTNAVLSTNILGQVSYNVQTPGFLTNGITQTAYQPLGYYVNTNQLSGLTNGFITASSLAGLASTQFVASSISASNVNLVTIFTLAASNAVTLAAANAQTTNLVAAQGFSSTNFTLLVGQNLTNYVAVIVAALPAQYNAAIAATNNQTLITVTGLVQTATTTVSNSLTANYLTAISNTNTANLITTTNLVNNSTNGGNIVFTNNQIWTSLVTNGFNYVASSNGIATFPIIAGGLIVGTKTNILAWTNSIGIGANGSGLSGTYLGQPNQVIWTNVANPMDTIFYSAGNYYIQSNGVSMYQSANIITWTLVNGVNPVPLGWFGAKLRFTGDVIDGTVYFEGTLVSTDLTWQITNSIGLANAGLTNFILSGFVQGFTTNNQISTSGSNVVIDLIGQYGVNPTNGISTNTALVLINAATNSLWAGVTNRGAVQWGSTTNPLTSPRPATFFLYVSNNIPQYGIWTTN